MKKITLFIHKSKGFENIADEDNLIRNIREEAQANGFEYKIIEDDKFESQSEDYREAK